MQSHTALMQRPAQLDWNAVRDFLAVARTGSLNRAAATLGVNATTVGRRIEALEVGAVKMVFNMAEMSACERAEGSALFATIVGGGCAGGAVLATLVGVGAEGWPGALLAQPAAWTVPLAFLTMVGVSLATPRRVPLHAARTMVRLHTPESVQLDRGHPPR